MKLAFTIFRYFKFGGLQKDFERCVAECIRRGHEVVVLANEWESDLPLAGTQLHVFAPQAITNHATAEIFESEVAAFLKKNPCDRLIGFNLMRGCDFMFVGDECLAASKHSRHSTFALSLNPRYRNLLRKEADVFSGDTGTHFFLISENQIRDFQFYYGLSEKRWTLLPPMFDMRCGNLKNRGEWRERVRKNLGIKPDDFALALIGSDFERKGIMSSLEAIKALPSGLFERTKLFLVGQSKIKRTLQRVRELDLEDRVIFLGGREDVPELLCGIDCLLHAAIEECGGSVLLEAMISGVPVICSAVCGFSKMVASEISKDLVLRRNFKQFEFNCVLANTLFNLEKIKSSINVERLRERYCNDARTTILVDLIEGKR